MRILFIDQVHIMSDESRHPHTNFDELVKVKIPALGSKASTNNRLILEYIALNGPKLPYDVHKDLEYDSNQYSTVNRRIRDLKKDGYLAEAGKRTTERGKQEEETMYGLTWRGFVASITERKVRENILQVLKKNPLLIIPSKELVLSVLERIITPQELEIIAESFLKPYLQAIPNLELIEDEHLFMFLFAIRERPKLPEGFKLSKIPQDLLELFDDPEILALVKSKIIPLIRAKTTELEAIYTMWKVLNELGNFISRLETQDKPSKRIKEYIETDLEESLEKILPD